MLTLDGASPATTVDGGAGSSGTTPYAFTSNSFTPPAKSVIIITYETGADPGTGSVTYDLTGAYPQITDSLGAHLTWHLVTVVFDNSSPGFNHQIAVWWAYAGAASPGPVTVTCTGRATAGKIGSGGTISVKIWDGANTGSPLGAVLSSGNAGTLATLSVTVTPASVLAGSAVFLAACVDGAANSSAGAGMTVTDTSGAHYIQEWPGSVTTSLAPVTLTETVSPAAEWQYIAYEVLPAPPPVVPVLAMSRTEVISSRAAARAVRR